MRTLILDYMQSLRSAVGKTAPYLLIELLLPGGTILALLLFLYRRKRGNGGDSSFAMPPLAVMAWVGDELGSISQAYGVAPAYGANERDGLEALGAMPAR